MSLIKSTLFSCYSVVGLVSAFVGIVLLSPKFWSYTCLTVALLLVVAVLHAAQKLLRARDQILVDATAKWSKERERLKAELIAARRDHFDEAVRDKLRRFVGELTAQEKAALEIFCTKGSAPDVQLDPTIPVETFRAVRGKAIGAGVMEFDESFWRDSRGKAYLVIPAYRAPLKKILGEVRRSDAASGL